MHFKTSENDTMRNPHLDRTHHEAFQSRCRVMDMNDYTKTSNHITNPEESESESTVIEMYSPSYYKQMKQHYSMCAKIHMTQYK